MLSSAGQPFKFTTAFTPGTWSRHFFKRRQPALNSCSPAPWLWLPAMRTIFFGSAAETKTQPRKSKAKAAVREVFICELRPLCPRNYSCATKTFWLAARRDGYCVLLLNSHSKEVSVEMKPKPLEVALPLTLVTLASGVPAGSGVGGKLGPRKSLVPFPGVIR